MSDTFSSTPQIDAAPRPGMSYSGMTSNPALAEMLRDAMHQEDPELPEDLDEPETLPEDEEDIPIDTRKLGNSVASAIGVSPTGKALAASVSSKPVQPAIVPDLEDIDELHLGEESTEPIAFKDKDDSEEESNGLSINPKLFMLIGVIVCAIVGAIVFFASQSDQHETSSTASASASTSTPVQDSVHRYANDILTPTDTQTYQDSMTINKYIEIVDDSCLFVFEGYAENARAFVKAYVDIEAYNTYKVGARVPIIYERITLSGKNYYMKVRLNLS